MCLHCNKQSCQQFYIQLVSLCLEMMNQALLGESGLVSMFQINQLSKLPMYWEYQLSTLC